ncbi:MAG: glutamine--fructose-6-phosphate transaminase (isomerizing) [Myxococcaceae bacterium]
MCGIVGYVGDKEVAPILLGGLKKLEYRGYDSAGLAVVGQALQVVRATGKLHNLENRLRTETPKGHLGIGHTRWATHGRPSDENAHPHTYKGVAVVHNGIIENHLALKNDLKAKGHVFSSETDSEVFAHLIAAQLEEGSSLPEAVRIAVSRVRGTYALAVVSERDPSRIVCTKDASPLVVGHAQGEVFLASDVPALLEHTREVVYLEDGDLAVLTALGAEVTNRRGQPVTRPVRTIDWTPAMAEKGGHRHFMHKEIWEQPRAVADTLRGRVLLSEGDVDLEGFDLSPTLVQGIERIVILACGTSWHSGLAGRFMIETLARLPVEVELASEFRYRDPLVDHRYLAVAVSQSGETADTLAALREAKSRGARTLAICNVVGSALTREADDVLLTHAGPEIGVASTKAFTTQLVCLYLLAIKFARARGRLSQQDAQKHLTQLTALPGLLEQALKCEPDAEKIARKYKAARGFLFLGRGAMHAVALEGALKLKEISYIHAEGYAGGEMKHGPIALVDDGLPVVVVTPKEPHVAYEKMASNVEEVRARSGHVIAVVEEGDEGISRLAEDVMRVPAAPALLAPIVDTIPLQLLAYHVANMLGHDVDQPRNLAKSVTVE